MFLIKYTETLDHDIDDIETIVSLYQTHERLITENLIRQVIPSFTKIAFFQKNCPQGLRLEDFIRVSLPSFRYEEFEFGQILYNFGDKNDKMYIVLGGSAMEFIPKKKQIWLTREVNTPSNSQHKRNGRQIEIWELVMQMQYSNPLYWGNGEKKYQYNTTYKIGEHFGDLSTDTNTKESVMASSQLQCISLKKSDYKMIFGRELPETRRNLDFFLNIFDYVSENKLLQLINLLQRVTYDRKHQLWQQGDKPEFMIFIVDGLVESYYYENVYQDDALVRKNKVCIREQSTGTLVGAEEILFQKRMRDYNCECKSQTDAFLLPIDLLPKLSNKFQEILRQMKTLAKKNIAYSSQRKTKIIQRKISQPTLNDQKYTSETQLTQEYFTSRKLKSSQIRSQQTSQLNLDQIVTLNQKINKSSEDRGINTIYPIENKEQAEIQIRLHIKHKKPSQQQLSMGNSKIEYLRQMQKRIFCKRFKDTKQFFFSPQITVSQISPLKSERIATPLPLDTTNTQRLYKQKQKVFDTSSSKNKQLSTQIYSARSSNIDFDNQIINLLRSREGSQFM